MPHKNALPHKATSKSYVQHWQSSMHIHVQTCSTKSQAGCTHCTVLCLACMYVHALHSKWRHRYLNATSRIFECDKPNESCSNIRVLLLERFRITLLGSLRIAQFDQRNEERARSWGEHTCVITRHQEYITRRVCNSLIPCCPDRISSWHD